MAASDEQPQKDEHDMKDEQQAEKDEKQAEKEYADFEARVKRTIYIDHLSPLVTSQVIKASLAQCANVVNTEFIENYTIQYEIPAAALVEVDNVSQAQAAVDLMNNFPFMIGGMPRPVRAVFAKPEMFPDRPRKPGLKIEFSWVKQGDPGYDGMNKLKGLMRRQEAENMALIKNQLEEEKELAAQQQETLGASSTKYDMLENLVNNGEITKLAQHYKEWTQCQSHKCHVPKSWNTGKGGSAWLAGESEEEMARGSKEAMASKVPRAEEGKCPASASVSHLLLLRGNEARGVGPGVHAHQPVQDGGVAGGDAGRELRGRRLRAPRWRFGGYANPVACQPTFYSKKFKAACPAAYSYAYDDPSSIFTCAQSPDYTITFCSSNMYEAIGVLVPRQPARLQRLRQEHLISTNACDAAASLQLPVIAICIPSVTD
ncbi:Thaumatin-like protein [Triticum urartu]|uniref:Thaumatin-like protein n=1 Tax=Triticum urartu TaxID=4572 RepID=M7ZS09_TRIUA|nr:Thaumatin-like protein [Triticum urartu]